jgi:hypothetical protein
MHSIAERPAPDASPYVSDSCILLTKGM